MNVLEPWDAQPIVVVDFETTGPDPATCEPVEMGLVRFEKGESVGSWSTLIHPRVEIPAEATEVHGITDAMILEAPFAEDVEIPAYLIEDAIPCAYNETFDRLVAARCIPSLPDHIRRARAWIDPCVMAQVVDKWARGAGRFKLSKTCERQGIVLNDAHRVEVDCMATGALLFVLAPQLRDGKGIAGMPLADVLYAQQVRRAERDRDFLTWLAKQPPREAA